VFAKAGGLALRRSARGRGAPKARNACLGLARLGSRRAATGASSLRAAPSGMHPG